MTATEVARSFSDVLNRVASGEEIEVTRNGAVVAVLSPSRTARMLSPEHMKEFFATAPPLDDDFLADVEAIRREAGPAIFRDPWES